MTSQQFDAYQALCAERRRPHATLAEVLWDLRILVSATRSRLRDSEIEHYGTHLIELELARREGRTVIVSDVGLALWHDTLDIELEEPT